MIRNTQSPSLGVTGPIATLFDGENGPMAALESAREIIDECQPGALQIHSGEPEATATELRTILPNVVVIVGIGIDETARNVKSGRRSVDWGIKHLVILAGRAVAAGAAALMLNGEVSYKAKPDSIEHKRLEELVQGALAAISETYPTLVLWHTSYDHPMYHRTLNWLAFLGPRSPITASFFQVYAAGEGKVMAARGALPWRQARAFASYGEAVQKKMIDADVPDGTPGDENDVDWRPYYQLHHVTAVDTITGALQHPVAALWALTSRSDKAGRNAYRALCSMHRAGLWMPGLETIPRAKYKTAIAVRLHQEKIGARGDGNYGPATAAKDGVKWET